MDGRDGLLAIHHFNFVVSDLRRTVEFYSKLGLQLRSTSRLVTNALEPSEPGQEWQGPSRVLDIAVMEHTGGIRVEFSQFVEPPSKPFYGDRETIGAAHLAFHVKNIKRARKHLETEGVKFLTPILRFQEAEHRPWLFCQFEDPDGMTVELIEEMPANYYLESMAERIRETRLARGLTLKELARVSGISIAHLSQIERGDAVPSVSALLNIASAIGVSSDFFFRPAPDRAGDWTAPVPTGPSPARAATDDHDSVPITCVVTAGDSTSVRVQGGVEWKTLTPPTAKIKLVEVRYEPGALSDETAAGQEGAMSGLVLEGSLVLASDSTRRIVDAGSLIVCDRSEPRRLSNVGEIPAVILWAISVASGPS